MKKLYITKKKFNTIRELLLIDSGTEPGYYPERIMAFTTFACREGKEVVRWKRKEFAETVRCTGEDFVDFLKEAKSIEDLMNCFSIRSRKKHPKCFTKKKQKRTKQTISFLMDIVHEEMKEYLRECS